jgi:parallel beta-helix repeat protein
LNHIGLGERKLFKRIVSGIMLTLLLIGMSTLAFNVQPVRTEPATIIVPDDYSTIQEAINHALEGDTVFVRNGTYYENVVVNKTLSLIGENKDETFVDGKGTGTVFTITQDDINITGFTIQNSKLDGGIDTGSGIYLAHAHYCNVKNNSIANNSYGIANYWSSNNNTICGNNIIENDQYGIDITEGDCNTICYNRLSFNRYAVILALSSYNTLRDNIISKNERTGIWFTVSSDHNILINNSVFNNGWDGIGGGYDSKHNLIHQNRIWNCSTGIYFDHNNYTNTVSNNFIGLGTGAAIFLDQTKNVTISNNTCLQNEIGIRLGFYTSDNIIYHNNFVNNTQQVDFWGPSYVNFWDDGYPSGGNYWSDYTGVDLYRSPYQNETGSDGIGDTPYVIDQNNADNYPLMKPLPWSSHDIGIANAATSKRVVGQGFNVPINVMVFNYGNNTENINITIYANSTLIGEINNIDLPGRNSTIITFSWNTTGFVKGKYTIWAYAWPVLGETDTTDNTFSDGWVIVSMVGDITGPDGWPDGKCDMRDIRAVAKLFGINYPDPRYDPNCDINDDLRIDMKDIRAVAKQFGKTDP